MEQGEEFKPKFSSPHIDFKTNPDAPSDNSSNFKCEKCKDTGIVKEKDGSCHTCWECLSSGRLDCHSKNLPESRIKL